MKWLLHRLQYAFGTVDRESLREEAAYQEGFAAGEAGKKNNPHARGTSDWHKWRQGHADGVAHVMMMY
jgi:hypothetical protein